MQTNITQLSFGPPATSELIERPGLFLARRRRAVASTRIS